MCFNLSFLLLLFLFFYFSIFYVAILDDAHTPRPKTEITNVIDTRKNYVAANEEAESMSLSGSRTINTPLTNLALFITALSIMAFAT